MSTTDLALIAALLPALIALVALVRQRRVDERREAREAAADERKSEAAGLAHVRLRWRPAIGKGFHHLDVVNAGPGDAYDVDVDFPVKQEWSYFEKVLPVKQLHADTRVSIEVVPVTAVDLPFNAQLSWRDSDGPHTIEQQVTE